MPLRCQGRTKTDYRCRRKATNGLWCFQHQPNDEIKRDLIIVYNPKNKLCEDGDGIDSGYDEVPKVDWERLKRGIQKHKSHFDRIIEHDYSNGGHGCIMEFNLYKLYQGLKIVKKIPKEAEDNLRTNLVDELINHLEKVSPSPKKPDRKIIKIGKTVKVAVNDDSDDDDGEIEEVEKVEIFVPFEIRYSLPSKLFDVCYCCSDTESGLGKDIVVFYEDPTKIKDIEKYCKENRIMVIN